MENPKHYAWMAWAGMAAGIAAWDVCRQDDTLTACWRRGLETKVGRVALPALLAVTGLHLMNKIEREHDPYYMLADVATKGLELAVRLRHQEQGALEWNEAASIPG